TNVYLKFHIQQEYRGDVHYVWCSEFFDATKAPAYSKAAMVPPTSNPADIYKDLKAAVQRSDHHNAKIQAQKAAFLALAVDWEARGQISADAKEEIIYMVEKGGFEMWRPLLYVIPRAATLEPRLETVPIAKRAGFGPEYIIRDLKRNEFDVIEL